MSQEIKPLSEFFAGQKVRLARIEAGRDLTGRLVSMGLLPQVEITIIANSQPGPFVISVRDSRIVLGRGMTDKILVYYETNVEPKTRD